MRGSKGLSKRIYILGVGNVGTFIAHSLAGVPNPPPMTLLLRRPERLRDYRTKGSMLKLTTHGITETRHDFDVEAMTRKGPDQSNPVPFVESERRPGGDSAASRHASKNQPISLQTYADISENTSNIDADDSNQTRVDSVIYHLIVTVKTPHTVNAIRPYAHRLTPQSTILFLQNGMGVMDEVNREVFPSEEDRPHYMIGILSHGLYSKDSFDVVHAGEGTIALGLMTEAKEYPESARFLLRTITRTPVFVAVGMEPRELLQQQLDKLAVNAVINPLTVLLNCLNGELLDNFYVTRLMRMLLAEISSVFRSLPEMQNVLNVGMRFDTARLESLVVRVAKLTGLNRSSMLQDVKASKQTEIDYINGYIIKRGEELGIPCITHYAIMQIIKAKSKMTRLEQTATTPPRPSSHRK